MACTSIVCAAPTPGWAAKGSFPLPKRDHRPLREHAYGAVNDELAAQLRDIKRGDLVDISGYLIEIKFPDNGIWRSSLTRTDTGNGGCELVWVIGVKKLE